MMRPYFELMNPIDSSAHVAHKFRSNFLEIETFGVIPKWHFSMLHYYGLFDPQIFHQGNTSMFRVVENMFSGDFSTALVWIQHHRLANAILSSENSDLTSMQEGLYENRIQLGVTYAGVNNKISHI